MTLQRRTPLKRKTPLRSAQSALGRRELQRTGRIKQMSDARRADLPRRAEVRAAIFARDGNRCRIKPLLKGSAWERCSGRLTVHELRKASTGGDTYTVENGIAACAFHNGWVEDHPALARKLGLVL